jgi:hypothetical protein
MEPITITDPDEIEAVLKARCFNLAAGLGHLSDDVALGNIFEGTEGLEAFQLTLARLEAATEALQAIRDEDGVDSLHLKVAAARDE